MSDVSISIGVTGKEATIAVFHDVSHAAKEMGDALMEHTKKLGELFLGYEGVVKAIEVFHSAIERGAQLKDLSENTNIAIKDLVLLQRAFQDNGMAADDVGKVFAKMDKSLEEIAGGGDKAAEKLAPLGLSLSDLQGLGNEAVFSKIAKGISGMTDEFARSTAAQEFFGKSGKNIQALLNNFPGAMNEAQKSTGNYAQTMQDNAAAFLEFNNALEAIGDKAVEFAAGALGPVIGSFNDLAAVMKDFDAADYGKKFFESWDSSIKAVVEALAHGQFRDAFNVILLDLVLYVDKMIDELKRVGVAGAAGIAAAFHTLFDEQLGISSPFVKEMEGVFDYLGLYLERAISMGLATLLEKLPLMKGVADDLRKGVTENIKEHSQYVPNPNGDDDNPILKVIPEQKSLNDQLKETAAALGKNAGSFGSNLIDAVSNAATTAAARYQGRTESESTREAQKNLNEASEQLLKKLGKGESEKPKTTEVGGEKPAISSGFGTTLLKGNQILPLDQFNLNTGLYKNTGTMSLADQATLQSISDSITKSPIALEAQKRASQLEGAGNYGSASQIRAHEAARERDEATRGLRQAAELAIRGNESLEDYKREHRMSDADYESAVQKRVGPVDPVTGKALGGSGPAGLTEKADPMTQILRLISDHLPKIDKSVEDFAVLA